MSSATNYQRPGQQLVVVRGQVVSPTVCDHYPQTATAVLGALQVICGLVHLGLVILTMVVTRIVELETVLAFIMAILAGSFSISAARSKTSCKIVTSLVLSIIATIVVVAICFSIIMISALNPTPPRIIHAAEAIELTFQQNVMFAMVGVFAVEATVSIWLSVIICHFLCSCCTNCCCNYDATVTQQVLLKDGQCEQGTLRDVTIEPAESALK